MIPLAAGVPLATYADTPTQRQELTAAVRQLDALQRLVEQSAADASITPGERYHFDYPRLLADLAQVRAGIQSHLTPSRAQPRDPAGLAGDYRADTTAPDAPPPGGRP
ncbi:RAQPRD family integrative conjugative element protein [Pseudomonas aeruginosa]|uniref:integrative conjugative element protein, RAQPRD family n=1 Tax=Pseudomonas aeruginosa TaxID=287 RepID=UPI000A720227